MWLGRQAPAEPPVPRVVVEAHGSEHGLVEWFQRHRRLERDEHGPFRCGHSAACDAYDHRIKVRALGAEGRNPFRDRLDRPVTLLSGREASFKGPATELTNTGMLTAVAPSGRCSSLGRRR